MKKLLALILSMIFLLLCFAGCDKSYNTSLNVVSSNKSIRILDGEEKTTSKNFEDSDFNRQPTENYANIDFSGSEKSQSNAKIYKINLNSTTEDNYTLSMYLTQPNKYVIDYVRVAILIDSELKVYKYYDEKEGIYHKDNDTDTLLHFKSKNEIFDNLEISFEENETKEMVVFVWIEEAELYDENGQRDKGWADKSYNATPINLNLGII